MPFKVVKSGGSKRAGFASLGEGLFSGAHLSLALALASVLTSSCRNPMPKPPSNVCNLRDKTASREQNVIEGMILCKKQAPETEKQGKLPISTP
jgi:hypothetical protein